jgi:hypothetical protein
MKEILQQKIGNFAQESVTSTLKYLLDTKGKSEAQQIVAKAKAQELVEEAIKNRNLENNTDIKKYYIDWLEENDKGKIIDISKL